MLSDEINELLEDVDDILYEFGSLNDKTFIKWYQRKASAHDELYKEDITPEYTAPIEIAGYVVEKLSKEMLDSLGLDPTKMPLVLYVAGKEIDRKKVEELDYKTLFKFDKIEYRDIIYNISAVKPISLVGRDVMYEIQCFAAREAREGEVDYIEEGGTLDYGIDGTYGDVRIVDMYK